jgi:chemotaxis protein MotB
MRAFLLGQGTPYLLAHSRRDVPPLRRRVRALLTTLAAAAPLVIAMPGCLVAPRTALNAANVQNRSLSEQNKAQLAEIENLKNHSRSLEDRLIRNEKQLATLQERAGLDQKQLQSYERERDQFYEHFKSMAVGRGRLPTELGNQFAELSQKYPGLQFDPETGISKLDTDILFDSGEAVLKPGAEKLLDDLARVMKSPAAGDLKIMVAGHTDGQLIAGKTVREKYPNNFHLSAARALAVADRLKRAGLAENRMAVAGFGASQPIASNTSARDRQKNRRVEIMVMAPDVPVVGWSDSMPSVYDAGVKR